MKIDLGREVWIDTVQFGRDRLAFFNDRDPGQFTIAVALSDNVYANGDDSDDHLEYTQVFDSATLGFDGQIDGPQTIQARFPSVLARYIKLTVAQAEAAIDEIEVFAAQTVGVTVRNVEPTITAITVPDRAVEGLPVTVSMTATDPGIHDRLTYRWELYYGDVLLANVWGQSYTFTPQDSGFYHLFAVAWDGQGGGAAQWVSIPVENVAPVVALSGSASAAEGSPYWLTIGTPFDPGQDTITAYSIDWGDGTVQAFTVAADGGPAGVYTHTFADGPNQYTIRVSLIDEDGAHADAGYLAS